MLLAGLFQLFASERGGENQRETKKKKALGLFVAALLELPVCL